jgi:two-component system OmpR family sensor kinase
VVAGFPHEDSTLETGGHLYGQGRGAVTDLDEDALGAFDDVPSDGSGHTVDVPGLGGYRAKAVDVRDGTVVVGLPTDEVDEAVRSLIGYEVVLIALGVVLAAGGGLLLVRRQLRPLREVAATADRVSALPLSEGDIDLTERVPEHLTDERTEVGQVGSALNTLLAHVETSLEARQASEQQLRQFVADASHELRTPLATIAGYTELARRRPDDDTVRTALDKVEEESARMTALVEDLLLLARLDAGRPLEREPVDLTRLLLEAVSDARVVGPDHQWHLDLPESPVEVVGDEQRLHQVVTNLLTNARKHTPSGTTVTVSVRPDGFDVHDDGPGFPPEFVDHAFERFARVDQARQRTGGAGLGLSLVEAIVRSHGGTVSITSAPSGTTIAVRLR